MRESGVFQGLLDVPFLLELEAEFPQPFPCCVEEEHERVVGQHGVIVAKDLRNDFLDLDPATFCDMSVYQG